MSGTYRYGSDLLNITFDPTRPSSMLVMALTMMASAAHRAVPNPPGYPAACPRRPDLADACRSPGVANSRACSWNRPIDRMANLNLEPGNASLEEMMAAVERGVYMKTNCSWSDLTTRAIDSSLAVKWGQLIEHGELTTVVKNANYRGISATFWRSLRWSGTRIRWRSWEPRTAARGEPNQVSVLAMPRPPAYSLTSRFSGGSGHARYSLHPGRCHHGATEGDEISAWTFRGEDSDFVRFNRSAVRQAGTCGATF